MKTRTPRYKSLLITLPVILLIGVQLACSRSALPEDGASWRVPGEAEPQPVAGGAALSTQASLLPPTRAPGEPILTPTPDNPHPLPTLRTEPLEYVVQPGDTLGTIAQRYGVNLEEIVNANSLINPNLLDVGQMLTIPVATPFGIGPDFKVIPDSELVYGPASASFDVAAFIQSQGGYLSRHREDIDDKPVTGIEVVQRVADDYSVNPRLLLAVLEYQSGWVTHPKPEEWTMKYPIGIQDEWRDSLYRQLAWAANQLNLGFYLWRVNGVSTWLLGDGSVAPAASTINAGTAGVQQFFSSLYDRAGWEKAVSPEGLFATYTALFGYPFDYAVEPLLPAGLRQPALMLPFGGDKAWAFTGGPHGGWDSGSAWAALDFAPPSDAIGCIISDEWVTASADGQIIRTGNGEVIQDLDGDSNEHTGWALLYMHVETRDRVQPGAYVRAGDHIGHPSCEGGVSSGTHVHLARKYNGEWIPADQQLPFILDGWVSRGTGGLYDGYLERDGKVVEAFAGRSSDNLVQR